MDDKFDFTGIQCGLAPLIARTLQNTEHKYIEIKIDPGAGKTIMNAFGVDQDWGVVISAGLGADTAKFTRKTSKFKLDPLGLV